MSGRYKTYPEYKDSGAEWLGKVPKDWDVIQIKHLSPIKRGASPRPIEDKIYFDYEGEYAWTRISDVTASDVYLTKAPQRLSELGSSLSVKLEPGSLFLSIAGSVGKPCITGIKACIHDGFVYFPELKIPNKFLFYVFAGEQAYKGLGKFGTQLNLNTDTVGSIKIGSSNNIELLKIVSFLDYETTKIDTLIEKQQQLIKLLKEKRQAIISHAVTKGLDPDAPMKDSGVEWLGEVPEHWEGPHKMKIVSSLKGRLGLKADEYKDEGPYVVSSAHFHYHKINWDICPHVTKERYELDSNIQLAEEDILLMKDGAALGKIAFVDQLPDKACLNSHLLLFRPFTIEKKASFISKYLFYFMQTSYFQEYITVYATGTTFLGVSQQTIGNYRIMLPPVSEQTKIVNFLDKEMKKINDLQVLQKQTVDLLQERRSALISAAVTGKIDVRDWIQPE